MPHDYTPDAKDCVPPDHMRRGEHSPFKCIFNRTDAAECLGLSLSAFDKLRKEEPFFDADRGDKKAGGTALWDARHLGLMADVLVGIIDLDLGKSTWHNYKTARLADLHELCLTIEDKYVRKLNRKLAAKRNKTREEKRRRQAGLEAAS